MPLLKTKNRGDASATPGSVARGGEENLTLIFGFVYHVRNNTCIHMRTGGPNIYIYRRGRIHKEPLEKYNNRKAYYTSNRIHLIYFTKQKI
jgi:hypothetical protein